MTFFSHVVKTQSYFIQQVQGIILMENWHLSVSWFCAVWVELISEYEGYDRK